MIWLKEKLLEATKNILINNLKIYESPYKEQKVVLVYDLNSVLSMEVSEAYIKNLENDSNALLINIDEIKKEDLIETLISLPKNSSVILVQSTNFRLNDFRMRMTLFKLGIWCLEHTHLKYIKDLEIENYADAIEYKTPYYNKLSNILKAKSDKATNMKIETRDGSIFLLEWWFEDMKQNTWDYTWRERWGTFPIWENFTEIIDFKKANGELTIYAFPDDILQVQFVKPFKIKIKESLITCDDPNCPEDFRKLLDRIARDEDGEVLLRELGFWLNNWISREKTLSDVNAYERIAWFHMSIWKKHWIYRKKFSPKVTQRYHIDIFPDVKAIYLDDEKIFEDEKYIIEL